MTAIATREFRVVDEGRAYLLTLDDLGIEFAVDRLRRKWNELVGELTVRCTMAGAHTYNGVLSVGDFNFSSIRVREDRAKYLAKRADASDLDWLSLLEEFTQRVLTAEREGQPAVLLRDLPRPTADDTLYVDGLPLLARHPIIWFGDGGAAKSYLALYIAGRLEQRHGVRVGLFDWELAGEDHRERLERLFGAKLPGVRYARCNRPFVHELDRLRRIVREEALDYVIFDSIAFACDGPPEAAEVAGRYFQSLRQLGIVGSLHIAHVAKGDNSDRKPFGSSFWHNGARATWFVKLAEAMPGGNQVSIALINRKSNLSGLRPAVGFEITFETDQTRFKGVDVADMADLAGQLPVRQRLVHALRHGAMNPEELASEVDAKLETIRREVRRNKGQFIVLNGGKIGLAETRR